MPTTGGFWGQTKNHVLAITRTFGLAAQVGEVGVGLAGPVSDLMLLALTAVVLRQAAMTTSHRWGLFRTA